VRRFYLNSDGKPCIWPIPSDCLWTDERYETDGVLAISWDTEFADEARVFSCMLAGLNVLKAELSEYEGAVRLIKCDDAVLGSEGYALEVCDSGVAIQANTGHGIINGCMTLIQLIQNTFDSSICGVRIIDKPAKAFRGVRVPFPKETDIPWFIRFVDLLAKYRVNLLLFDIGDAARFVSDIKAQGHLRSSVDEMCSRISERHIEIIPCVNYPSCKENMGCFYEITRSLSAKTVAVRFIDVFEDCNGNTAAQELASRICAVHAWLGEQEVHMAVWSDKLFPATGGRKLRYNEDTRRNDVIPSTWEAVDLISKDILIIDENHRGMFEDTGSECFFTSRGFTVVFGNCSGPLKKWERRIENEKVAGAFVSVAAGACDEALSAGENKISAVMKVSCLLWWAGYKADHTSRGYLLPSFLEGEIAQLYPRERDCLNREVRPSTKNSGYSTVEMRKFYNSPLQHSYWRVDDHYMMFLKDAMNLPNTMPFSLFQGVLDFRFENAFAMAGGSWNDGLYGIPVNCKARGIAFLHAYIIGKKQFIAGEDSIQGKNVGRYIVLYKDGTKQNIDINYGRTIYFWKNFHGTNMGAFYANPVLMGMSPEGLHYTIYAQEWINDRPDVEIESLDVSPAREMDGRIALFGITAIK
jgi:hypothetical protein